MPLEATIGQTISHYRVLAKLGEGGMGVVWKAHDTLLNRVVALKVLPADFSHDRSRILRFEQEARAAAALNHSGIASVYDAGEQEGLRYIVSEFVEGRTLRLLFGEGLLSHRKAVDIATQLAEALSVAHGAGIVHRDLKPENVMITREGRAKILDFGLARYMSRGVGSDQTATLTLTQEGTVVGTPGYMSPEQVRGEPPDHRSDIFSLGLVLHEMLSGKRTFHRPTVAETLAAIVKEEPPALPTSVGSAVSGIVSHCLEKQPGNRFQSVHDLAFALRSASTSSAPVPALPLSRPRRQTILLAAGLVALMLAGLVASIWLPAGPAVDVTKLRFTPIATVMHQRRIEEGGGTGSQLPAWSPDGKSIVYSADGLRLQRIDSSESSPLTDKGVHPFFSPDGTRIYYLTSGDTPRELWSVSLAGGVPERVLAGLGGFGPLMNGAAISPDGRALAVVAPRAAGNEEMSIWESSPPGAALRPYPGSPGGRFLSRAWLRFSHDGSRLLVLLITADNSASWWLLNWPPPAAVKAGGVRRLFEKGPRGWLGFAGDWLLDDRHLVISVPEQGNHGGPLWIADTVTEKWSLVSPGPLQHLAPTVSRGGRVLENISRSDENAIEIPLDGSAIRPLLVGFRREQYPVWSPVAEQILFVSNERGIPEIWLASRKEGWQRPIVTQGDFPPQSNVRQFVCPVFSPDGARIAYTSDGAIWVSQVSGGPPVRITDGYCATWSPDGQWLAFAPTPRRDAQALMKVPVGRPRDVSVVRNAAGRFLPRWSPDGRWITIQLPNGFGVVSPDGARTKVLHKGPLDFGSACGWSRDSSRLFVAYLTPQGRVLSAIEVATGTESRVRDLGPLHFSYFMMYSTGLSPSPDGKSLAASTWSVRFEPWILDGLEPPRSFWGRLFRRW